MADPRERTLVTAGRDAEPQLSPEENEKRNRVSQILMEARERFRTSMAAEGTLRQNQFDDLRFVASEQWHPADVQQRYMDQRPCYTINRLPQFIRQVVNGVRQAKPAVQIHPVDSGADIETAEVFQGLIRHIEVQSDSLLSYVTAAESQARIGVGYWTISAEFVSDVAFQQELRIKRVRNSFSIVLDQACQEPDASDMRYCFVIEDMPKDLYKQRYGDASFASLTAFNMGPDRSQDWMPEGKVRVAAYWYVDVTEDEVLLVRWPDGQEEVVLRSIFDQWPQMQRDIATIAKRRPYENRQVKCALINAIEILEGNADKTEGALWPGRWIPVIRVIGDEIDLNGQIDLRGMVRDAKDPQRLYNYQNTALAEALALAPKAPFVGTEGQFEGHEDKWRQANRRNFPYLEVKPVSLGGVFAPYPQRNEVGANIGPIVAAIQQADNDLKATTGLYDASLGDRTSEQQSGKAIAAQVKQGELANSNFLDNLVRGIRRTGLMLLDLIPHYYDAPRVIRILGIDKKPKTVMVHAGQSQSVPSELPEGVEKIYDLSAGRYDVVVEVGQRTETARQETREGLTAIITAAPQLTPILADIVVGNMDFPGAQTAEKRLQKMLPPNLQEGNPQAEMPPEAIQQMEQAGQQAQMAQQQMQAMGAELQDAKQKLAVNEAKAQADLRRTQMEIASKERLERENIQSRERIAAMGQQAQMAKTQMQAQIDAQENQFNVSAEHQRETRQQLHERVMAAEEHLRQLKRAEHAAALAPEPESVAAGPEA